jgi:molybdenum cofactor biosynthesis enzyme MoaA
MQLTEAATERTGPDYGRSVNGLDFLWLELTDKCNLACVHCYADSSPLLPLFQGMQLADWKRVLAESREAGCRKVQFIGGEPAIYPHLIELIQYSRALGYELVEVFTNGTAFTEAIRDAFGQCNVSLAFSAYGGNASIHDSVTLRAGSFSKTVQSVEWALKTGLAVRVAIVETSRNSEAIEATRSFFEALGVSEVRVDRTRGVGRGSIAGDVTSAFDELCGGCWQGKLCVAPTGDMFPCVFSRSWIVGTAAEGVKAALEGRRLLDFRSTLRQKLLEDAVNCIPAHRGPEPDEPEPCNPERSMDALPRHYPAYEKKCLPEDEERCIPARRTSAPARTYQDRGKCAPVCERCLPIKHTGGPENSYL